MYIINAKKSIVKGLNIYIDLFISERKQLSVAKQTEHEIPIYLINKYLHIYVYFE